MLTIYKASAGSGKTYTLAFEYIKMLLGEKLPDGTYRLINPPMADSSRLSSRHRSILAITFTNKATEEMKSRIIKELSAIAVDHDNPGEDSDYTKKFLKEFACALPDLRRTAAWALKGLLFDYHHFNVSTIDSFFQSVLRSFAREVDRQGDYGIELSDEFAVSAGVGLMLDDLNYGKPKNGADKLRRNQIINWIRDYTFDLTSNGYDGGSVFNRSGNVMGPLVKYVKGMGSETFKSEAKKVLDYLADPTKMQAFIAAVDNRLAQLTDGLQPTASALLLDLQNLGFDCKALPSAVLTVFNKITANESVDSEAFNKVGVKKAIDWVPGADLYVKAHTKKGCPPDSYSQRLSEFFISVRDSIAEVKALEVIRKSCPNLVFLGFAWRYIEQFREENNLILLSDTHDLLRRIIGKSECPFIYERLGVTLEHFLIDEFQDTSRMQWHNLRPLVANSVSDLKDSLIIGDEKQAIYRFRNSTSELLHHVVAQQFPGQNRQRGNVPEENTNYRSSHGVVMFNNALFSRVAGSTGDRPKPHYSLDVDSYDNTIQALASGKKHLTSYITVSATKGIDSPDDWPVQFHRIAREMLREHADGYKWSDIAVLVREKGEGAAFVNFLLALHPEIKVLSDEALMLQNSSAVKLVISMLKMIDNSYSALDSVAAGDPTSNQPVYASSGDVRLMISRFQYLVSQGNDEQKALLLALDPSGSEESRRLAESIIDVRRSHPSDLVTLVETIINKNISEQTRANEYAYLAAFQDEVIKYCARFNPSVHAFLEWWEEASANLAISSGAGLDAVRVMTVHAAKGLEWDCVHIPFADWALYRYDEKIWIEPNMFSFASPDITPPLLNITLNKSCGLEGSPLAEITAANIKAQHIDSLNITYVAYTRAGRELHIYYNKSVNPTNPAESGKSTSNVVGSIALPALIDNSVGPISDCLDLAQYIVPGDPDGLIFCYGSPTKHDVLSDDAATEPTVEHADDSSEEHHTAFLPTYGAFVGSEIAAYTSLADATANLGLPDDDDLNGPDLPDESESYDSSALAAAAERGTQLHSIMADITSVDDIDAVISRAAMRYDLSPETVDAYRSIVEQAFESAAGHVDRWFDPDATILKEQSIYDPVKCRTYRPDRIVISPDGSVDVVDYKFTVRPLGSHAVQVKEYLDILRNMGYSEVHGFLWYPEHRFIENV